MVIWSGFGFIVAVVVFGSSLLMEMVTEWITGDDQFYQESNWAFPLAMVIAGVVTYAFDRWLTKRHPGSHTLFFVPMRWWPPILFVIALITLAYRAANNPAG